ncbi:MAG: flagellar assembly protein FliH [Phenylobacterium zucineum]|nr:MAG: flagellar assembly protein FliH [Phenylobacterium zucineum]
MTGQAVEKFAFDTIFDGEGDVIFAAPRPKRTFTSDEVELLEHQAFREGERQALASMAALQAQSLSAIATEAKLALNSLAEVAHHHRVSCADLALACGRAIADAALDAFPQSVLKSAIDTLSRELESAPRLLVSVSPDMVEGLSKIMDDAAQGIGFSGAIQIRTDPSLSRAAFSLDFGDGTAGFDPEAAAQRVADALTAALASEGLHAEPLHPVTESTS